MSELSVRETAARALDWAAFDIEWADGGAQARAQGKAHTMARRVLAAVVDHDGLVEVLAGHRSCPCGCDRCQCGSSIGAEPTPFAAHLADVVRAWLVQP